MNRKTLTALKGSIKKWEKIVAGKGVDYGSDNCPLCALFIKQGCNGCPVAEKTGEIFCDSTPYDDFFVASYRFSVTGGGADSPEALKAAKAELKFLKSLLPKEKKS